MQMNQFQPSLPCLGHKNPQTPSRRTSSLFLPPHPSQQSENAGSGSPLGPSDIQTVIKSELEESDVPYLEIGNLHPESSKRDSPVPPMSSTPPRSPTRPDSSDEQLLSRSCPIPLTSVLPRHTSPAIQTSNGAFPPPGVPNSPIGSPTDFSKPPPTTKRTSRTYTTTPKRVAR
ncbi:hypothetical protein BKA61DRAFT_243214 [Leptodontidium sp. MPI-SDFR-AT-0119]|nr:hypothetical protein BKA61DRAFT_243214 [Leptodontidium sp. MPI-SDFR-AT-0119]